jgi:hypothetical protein
MPRAETLIDQTWAVCAFTLHHLFPMAVVRTVSYRAQAASDADAAILKAVATVLDVDLTVTARGDDDDGTASSTTLEIAYYNAFSNADTKLKGVSLTGCVRLLASQTELAVTPEMESWLYATEQTVLPSVRQGEFLLICRTKPPVC